MDRDAVARDGADSVIRLHLMLSAESASNADRTDPERIAARPREKRRCRMCLPRGMGAAELANGGVDLLGSLEVADVAAVWDHDELGVRDRSLELVRDAEW